MDSKAAVPPALRTWFVVHCVADCLVGLPLFVAPGQSLRLLGWQTVDPGMTRLVAAALFGIGIQSFLGRHDGPATYRAMLNLKIIWSSAALVGILWTLAAGEAPPVAWVFFVVFAVFSGAWWWFSRRLAHE
jgi:hypothetical protein